MFHFEWLLGWYLSIDDKMIVSKGRHVYNIRIMINNKGGVFQADVFCNQGYTYAFY